MTSNFTALYFRAIELGPCELIEQIYLDSDIIGIAFQVHKLLILRFLILLSALISI